MTRSHGIDHFPTLSVVMPVLNEGGSIDAALAALAPLRARDIDVVVADGGSTDGTRDRARPVCDVVLSAPRGRGAQMNAGAAAARGDILVFLHADCRLPPDAPDAIVDGLAGTGRVWGRFDATIDGRHPLLRVVAALMNLRSRLTGIATGDQAMFVRRAAFEAVGGFEDIALMEDIAISRALLRLGRPVCLRQRVVTSGRRWKTGGTLRTIALMWRLRLAYWRGADPAGLARRYGYAPRE